jgi:HSP20 family protein
MTEPRQPSMPESSPSEQPQKQPRREQPETATSIAPARTAAPTRQGSPLSFLRRFIGDMDRLFDEFGLGMPTLLPLAPRAAEMLGRGPWAPEMDVFEKDDQLVVHADLPGMSEDDVRVSVDEGVLTISGERAHEHQHEKGGVHLCERAYGSFQRSITLPEGVDPESIQATFDDGVLEVKMPMPKKKEEAKGRSIPIGAKGAPGVKH